MAGTEPTYSDAQIEEKLKEFPGWWYEDGWIRRNYKTDGWPTTLMLVNAIGYLAEPALRRTLAEMAPAFSCDVAVMKITVAALMTTPWIARFLDVPAGADLVLIPGLSEGDPAVIAEKVGVRVEKGPKDLREIPEYFGRTATMRAYGAYDIEIVAEVNN